MEILNNIIDIVEAATGSFASNIEANATADQARAKAIQTAVDIQAMKARNTERRKDEAMQIVKYVLIALAVGGVLSILIIAAIKTGKKK